MKCTELSGPILLLALAASARAENCSLTIEANDLMQFNTREMTVPAGCTEVEITLKHSGKLDSRAMGHDWVLAKSSDVSAILNAAIAAGSAHGYLPDADKRILAATRIVGGGESTSVRLSTDQIKDGEKYAFFCTTPGHATLMRGKFLLTQPKQVAANKR